MALVYLTIFPIGRPLQSPDRGDIGRSRITSFCVLLWQETSKEGDCWSGRYFDIFRHSSLLFRKLIVGILSRINQDMSREIQNKWLTFI